MRRNKTNTDMLENVAEIAVLCYTHLDWDKFRAANNLHDSIEARFFVIDAALMFDRAEKRFSKLPGFKFTWLEATEKFVNTLIGGNSDAATSDISEKNIEALATQAIRGASN